MSYPKKKSERRFSDGPLPMLGNKVPPHATEAEIAVLGSMMLDRQAIAKAIDVLEPESFYNPAHKKIFETILRMFDSGISVDIITLSNELSKEGALDFVGGAYYLTEINGRTPTAANVEYHAWIVQEKALKRQLIDASGMILTNAYDDSTDALEEIDNAEAEIFKIAEKRFRRGYEHIKKVAHETIDLINRLAERDSSGLTGIESGFRELDKMLGGFQNSDLVIIAARPSMGKTALALSMARNMAVEYKEPVAFFSIEMSSQQLVIRLLSAESRINQQKIRTGMVSQDDMTKIVHSLGKLSDSPIIIDDSPMLTIMELRAKCRRLKAEYGIKIVFIDYLQLMHSPKAESREREISMISQALKSIAKELNIPVVALAQLNRSIEARKDRRPMLSDLRESGSIEQDADVVMFVNRPEVYHEAAYDDGTPTEGTAEIIIGKQRNGPIGNIKVAFQKDFARFENLAYQYEEPPANIMKLEDEEPGF
ncbi:MAG: replicative DNA helicase [Candidatus Kapaibacterium sp.]